MKSFLLGGAALAAMLMIQSAPASAQGVYGAGHPRGRPWRRRSWLSRSRLVHGAGRYQYQHGGYGYGGGPGYDVGAGVAAAAAGALIGGAIASQNQGYYPGGAYPVYSDPGYGYGGDPGMYGGGSGYVRRRRSGCVRRRSSCVRRRGSGRVWRRRFRGLLRTDVPII